MGSTRLPSAPMERSLPAAAEDQTVRLWEVDSGECLKTLQGHTSSVWSVAFSPDGSIVASGGYDQTMLWEVSSGKCLKTLQGHTMGLYRSPSVPMGALLPAVVMIRRCAYGR